MLYLWYFIDRIISGALIYYSLNELKNFDYAFPSIAILFLGSFIGILRRGKSHILIKLAIGLAYFIVGALFFWLIFSGFFSTEQHYRTPLIYLLISLKIIQAFDPPESRDLIFSLILTLFFALVLFYWAY